MTDPAPEIRCQAKRWGDGVDARGDLPMRVAGMRGEGCEASVRRVVQGIDPAAEVEVGRARERVAIRTSARSLVLADAPTEAGDTATAMTG